MKLTVLRDTFTAQSTTGELLIDGDFFCYTLEPRGDRTQGKPYCIPSGTYVVKLLWSNRFQMLTPHIMDVPGFTLIEIHPGNSPVDTEGCTLVGMNRAADVVESSRLAFGKLMERLRTADDISSTYIGGC